MATAGGSLIISIIRRKKWLKQEAKTLVQRLINRSFSVHAVEKFR
jgi:hypothetical protein